jgi:hypothetical protein
MRILFKWLCTLLASPYKPKSGQLSSAPSLLQSAWGVCIVVKWEPQMPCSAVLQHLFTAPADFSEDLALPCSRTQKTGCSFRASAGFWTICPSY